MSTEECFRFIPSRKHEVDMQMIGQITQTDGSKGNFITNVVLKASLPEYILNMFVT